MYAKYNREQRKEYSQSNGLTGNESSTKRKFPGQFFPGSECSSERIGQGLIGTFALKNDWSGSEKA